MSNFNRFCARARNTVKRLSDKAEELVDSTAIAFKKKALQIRIDEQYEKLGELVYRDLHTEDDLEDEKLQVIAVIDGLFDELEELNRDEESEPTEEAAPADTPAEDAEQ